jgi:DNA excision repair protein ERCC-2
MAEEFFPYSSFRPGQREVLKRIREDSGSSKILILKAPTGFGKTGIGIATGMMKPPAIHSVRTRNEITPVLRDLKKLSTKVRGIRYSFIHSAHAMCPLLNNKKIDPEDFWLNCQILRELGLCSYYAKSLSTPEEYIEEVLASSENHVDSVRRISKELGACPFFSLAKLARSSDYVVATYPYVFSRDLFSTIYPDENPESFLAIIDEAHMIIDPSIIYSSEISVSRIRASINEVREYIGGDPFSEDLLDRLSKLVEERASDEKLKKVDRASMGIDEDSIDHILDISIEVKKRAIDRVISRGSIKDVASKRVSLVKVALSLALLEDSRFEAFAYRDSQGAWLKISAVDHGVISEALHTYRSAILMSGTPPSKDYVKRILGLGSVSYIDAVETGAWSPYSNMAVILTSQLTSRYIERGDAMYQLYSRYIEIIDKLLEGAKLVVYPSYEFMRRVVEKLGWRGYVEDRESTIDDLVRSVKEDIVIHVVAGGKLSEGIELVSNGRSLIKCVFIAGVPYPQRDDYIEELLKNMRKKVSDREAWDYIYNMTSSIKAMQAIGRSVRSEEDKALIVLGDRRFMSQDIRKYMGIRIGRIARNTEEFKSLIEVVANNFL